MTNRTINGLLIEDDPDDALLLMNLLATSDWPSFKFAFTCAESLEEGLKLLAGSEVEVILLDLMLPDSRGIETVEKVHAHAPDVPIVVLTGLQDEAMGFDALSHGAQDYQVKGSLDGHALKRTISYAVERHRLFVNLNRIIDGAPDGMIILDAGGVVRYSNPAAQTLLGQKPDSLLGAPFPHPMPKGRSGELKIAVEGSGESLAEIRLTEVEWRDQPATLLSLRDITDLRRVQQIKAEIQERRRMDQLKDELLSTISHEMRSPLTIIKAASANMKEGLTGALSDKQTQMIHLQFKNILRLEKIVDNVLDLHRLESGKALIMRRNVSAQRLIRDVISGYQMLAREHDILIQQEMPPELPPIYADPELFVQVLSNLLDNAMRFAKSQIVVKASAQDSAQEEMPAGRNGHGGPEVMTDRKYVRVSVIDDGGGVPPDRLGDLFNKFVQVDRSSKPGYKGTGLGLAICKEIIDRQDGKIWAESRADSGALFHFLLPQYRPSLEKGDGRR